MIVKKKSIVGLRSRNRNQRSPSVRVWLLDRTGSPYQEVGSRLRISNAQREQDSFRKLSRSIVSPGGWRLAAAEGIGREVGSPSSPGPPTPSTVTTKRSQSARERAGVDEEA